MPNSGYGTRWISSSMRCPDWSSLSAASASSIGSGGSSQRASTIRSSIASGHGAHASDHLFRFAGQHAVGHLVQDLFFLHVVLLHEDEQRVGIAEKTVPVLAHEGGGHLVEQHVHLA